MFKLEDLSEVDRQLAVEYMELGMSEERAIEAAVGDQVVSDARGMVELGFTMTEAVEACLPKPPSRWDVDALDAVAARMRNRVPSMSRRQAIVEAIAVALIDERHVSDKEATRAARAAVELAEAGHAKATPIVVMLLERATASDRSAARTATEVREALAQVAEHGDVVRSGKVIRHGKTENERFLELRRQGVPIAEATRRAHEEAGVTR